MAFFEKITAAAKQAGDKANTAIEIGKLNVKIKSENASIEQFKAQIGDLLWAQFQQGNVTDPQVVALCESIAAANANIDELQAKIDVLKTEAPVGFTPAQPVERHCPQCGAVVADDARFCNSCGVRLQTQAEPAAESHAEE